MNKALRYNQDKIRMELLPVRPLEDIAKVFTFGAKKYTVKDEEGNIIVDGANNWRRGLSWTGVLGSLKRHIAAYERGEDFDSDSGLFHLAHAGCNIAFLLEYYRTYPKGDDRQHSYLEVPKVGLDIDEVVCNWVDYWCAHHNLPIPRNWMFDRRIRDKFTALREDKDFWLSIPPKISPDEIAFEPHCYITSRVIPSAWTEEWLDKHGFSANAVYTVDRGVSKVDIAKESGIDLFIDDYYQNFVELNKAGIPCYLLTAPHNERYNVGYKRIHHINDVLHLLEMVTVNNVFYIDLRFKKPYKNKVWIGYPGERGSIILAPDNPDHIRILHFIKDKLHDNLKNLITEYITTHGIRSKV